MSRGHAVMRPVVRHIRPSPRAASCRRQFTTGAARAAADLRDQAQEQHGSQPKGTAPPAAADPGPLDLDPNTVLPEFESLLIKEGKMPVGSRRRRVTMRSIANPIPFEQLPFQAFQEARKILAADREEKMAAIKAELGKIAKLQKTEANESHGGQERLDRKIDGLRRYVEKLKIEADTNDPLVKKRFEDGLGDMNKPIYRRYAERKWRSYDHRLITQRIKQFNIVPDMLPKLDPVADVQLYFRRGKVPPGDIVDSAVSQTPPRLRVQVFDKGERLVSVVVVDSDVPKPDINGFAKRVHFLAANIPLSPTDTSLPLSTIRADDQLALPWLPPFSQKGAPYHRLGIYLLEQKPGERVDVGKLKELYTQREGFSLKSYRDKFGMTPFGFNMFRSVWDENTADVMRRHNLEGAETEFRPARVYSLKPPVKPRGWEAKRQGPKYRHLWKYTKRIRGVSNARGWVKKR